MPKQRIQVDGGPGGGNALAITARPNDTFVSQSGAGSQAAQLADALSSIAPALARAGNQLYERKATGDFAKGAESARETVRTLDESRTSFAEAVREGKIPAHMNPWMKQGYYEELGRAYAGRFQADLTAAIQMDEGLKNSIEMEDFRAYTAKFEGEWREANVPKEFRNEAFTVGYGNRRDAIVQNLEHGYSAQTEQRFTKRSLAMFRDESVSYLQEALDLEQTPEEIGGFLRKIWDDKHALGWDGRLTGTTLVDAISDVALSRKDPELMEALLKQIPGGDGTSKKSSLANTAYAIEATEKTADAIAGARRREWSVADREREDHGRRIETDAAKRFEAAEAAGEPPDSVEIDDLQAEAISIGDVNLVDRIRVRKDAYRNDEYQDDNDQVADFLLKLHTGPFTLKKAELDTALRGKTLSLQTYSSLVNQLESAQDQARREAKAGAGGGGVFLEGDKYHEYGEKAVKGYFGSSPDADTPAIAFRRQQTLRQYSAWYYNQFVKEGAPQSNVSGLDRRVAIDAYAENLARSNVLYDDLDGTTMIGGLPDWGTDIVDTPERLSPRLTELESFLNGSASGRPSPSLVSLLSVHGIDLSNRKQLQDFWLSQSVKVRRQERPKPNTKRSN